MVKGHKSPHPTWATQHRQPGTELRLIRGKYYLYGVSSRYDPELKRAKKISGKILGSITKENGFIKSEKRALVERAAKPLNIKNICVREYGITSFLNEYNSRIAQQLKHYFPDHFQLIIYMAFTRLVQNSPLKNMAFHISKSMLSINDPSSYNEKTFSLALREIGAMRDHVSDYLKSFIKPNDYVLVDMTNMFSASSHMRFSKEGYNSDLIFDKQFNLMYVYSPSLVQPVYYRLFCGNIKEVRGFKLCLQESGIAEAVVIADKGFYSKANIASLQQEGLQYIIPLKRDNSLIQYDNLDRKKLSYFKFEERYIWYIRYLHQGENVFLFKDEKLKVQEEKDYLDRIETLPEYYEIKAFHQKNERFGTIALISNATNQDPQHIFTSYKSRNQIEVMFDGIKNILHADRTYMQNEEALQGWMFINHIALQWYYQIYNLLKKHNQLKRYSVRDFITHLYEIKKVKINEDWITEPIIKSSALFLEKLKIDIT